jgi:hypothetical protein
MAWGTGAKAQANPPQESVQHTISDRDFGSAPKGPPLQEKTGDYRRGSDEILAHIRPVHDKKFGLIQEYADHWGKRTNEQSLSFIRRWLDADVVETAHLRQKYVPIASKVLDGKKSAIFFQLDRHIAMMLELQVSSQMPLVQAQ